MSIDSSQEAWEQGFAAGLLGDAECLYFAGTDEALTWLSAWIEGERIRLVQIARHTRLIDVRKAYLIGARRDFRSPRLPARATGPERMASYRSIG